MRANIWKRCLAGALAATMILTSSDLGWAAAKATEAEEKENVKLEFSAPSLIADNYSELSEVEKEILYSSAIRGDRFQITKPTSGDDLAAVDSDNRKVYAQHFAADGQVWKAVQAKVLVNNIVTATVDLEEGSYTYEEKSFDAAADFAVASDDYSVEIVYELHISDTEGAYKDLYLNLPYEMAEATANMKAIVSGLPSWNLLVQNVAPSLKKYVDGSEKIQFTGQLKQVVVSWLAQNEKYGRSELSHLLNSEGGYRHSGTTEKLENILTRGADYRRCVISAYEDLQVLTSNSVFQLLYPDEVDMMREVMLKFEPAALSDWAFLEDADLLDVTQDTAALDQLAEKIAGKSKKIEAETKTSLLAGTATVTCNVNRYNVHTTVEIYGVDKDTNTVKLLRTTTKDISLASGLTKEDAIAAVEAADVETGLLSDLEAETNGYYAVNTTNYDRTVSTTLSGNLEADADYTVRYYPKKCTVDYDDTKEVDEEVYFGTTILFPRAAEEGKSYEYTVGNEIYEEGTSFRVLGNLTIGRALTKEKTQFRVNDIVVSNYAGSLSATAQQILQNLAVASDVIAVRLPDDRIELSEAAGKASVYAPDYNAGNGMTWKPYRATVKNGQTEVEVLVFGEGNTVTITAGAYTSVDVEYRLAVDITGAELLLALNLPATLITEAKEQLADLAQLLSYEGDIDQVNYGTLDLVAGKLNDASKAAIAKIKEGGLASDGSTLLLSTYIDAYKGLTDEDRLDYYYNNSMYVKIKTQIILLSESVSILIDDPALPELLASLGKAEYVEKLSGIAEKLTTMSERFPAKNEHILLTGSGYRSLLGLLVSGTADEEIVTADGLYCMTTFAKMVSTRKEVKITIQIADGLGNIASSLIRRYSDTFEMEEGMTEEDLRLFAEKLASFEQELGLDKEHYELVVTGALPQAGEALSENISVVYTWSPKTYTVRYEDGSTLTLTADLRRLVLPGTGTVNLKYYYTIGDREIEVGAEDVTVTLSLAEIDALFTDGSYTIIRRETDVARENIEKIIADLNKNLVASGQEYASSFLLMEDAEGKLTIVWRMNPFDKQSSDALQTIVMGLASQSYVEIGDEVFISKGIYLDAFVQAILNSGLSTTKIEEMIDENGDLAENLAEVLAGYTFVEKAIQNVPQKEAYGALLAETTFALDAGKDEIPLYITMQDFDRNAEDLQKFDKSMQDIAEFAEIRFENGYMNADLRLPEDSFELYMTLMILEGKIDVEAFATPSFVEIMDYMIHLFKEPVILNEAVTEETILNTFRLFGAGDSMDGSRDVIKELLRILKELLDEDETNGKVTAMNGANQEHDRYRADLEYPSSQVAESMKLPEGMASLLLGDMYIPMNLRLENCNNEYTGLVIHTEEKNLYHIAEYNQWAHLTTEKEDVRVIVLSDLESLAAFGKTHVNLNGHRVETLIANADVTIDDNTHKADAAGTVLRFGGEGRIEIAGGTYDFDIASYLKEDSIQTNGHVENRYYRLTEDAEGNLVIALTKEYLELTDAAAYEKVLLSLVSDLVGASLLYASMTVSGDKTYPLYEMRQEDLVSRLEDGMKALLEELTGGINHANFSGWINELAEKLTDFEAIAKAIENGTDLFSFTLEAKNWGCEFVKAEDGDYLTINILPERATDRKLTITTEAAEEERQELAEYYKELAKIYGAEKGKIDIDLTVEKISLGEDGSYQLTVSSKADIIADLSAEEHMTIFGILLAYGSADREALLVPLKAMLGGRDDAQNDLIRVIEAMSVEEIRTALISCEGKAWTEITETLGLGSVALSNHTIRILSTVWKNAKAEDETKDLATFGTGKFGCYQVSRDLQIVLSRETVSIPEITVTTTTIAQIKNSKIDKNYIYVDVKDRNGLSETEFLKSLVIAASCGKITSVEFSMTDNALIQTGETVTITAVNTGILDTDKKETTSTTYTIIVLGDVNGDGRFRSNDASLILAHRVGKKLITDANQLLAAQVNKSAGLDAGDAAIILRKAVGKTYKTWLD